MHEQEKEYKIRLDTFFQSVSLSTSDAKNYQAPFLRGLYNGMAIANKYVHNEYLIHNMSHIKGYLDIREKKIKEFNIGL